MKYLAVFVLAIVPLVTVAHDHVFVGYKYFPGDTAWFQTHLVSKTAIGVSHSPDSTPSARPVMPAMVTKTVMEQTVSNHQYTLTHSDSSAVIVIMYDSLKLSFGGDSTIINYDSNNPADSLASYNMMVYPLKTLIGQPLTVYINAQGKIDSVRGIDKAVEMASKKLNRSVQIAALKDALNDEKMQDLLEQSLANLPNTTISANQPIKFTRARMVGITQFLDEVVTSLVRATADTAWLTRATYTRVASPTIRYGGATCVIDSTWGTGDQTIVYDIPRGVILQSHEQFSNYLRAGIANTNTSVIQTNDLIADIRMLDYKTKSEKKKRR